MKSFWIGGKNAVISAINNKNRDIKTLVTSRHYEEIKKKNSRNLLIKEVSDSFFSKIFKDKFFVHQHIAAEIFECENNNLEFEIKKLNKLIILDHVTDPRNIGSIIRTSVAFGVDGLIVKKKHFNSQSPYMYKTASGATEMIKIFKVINISQSIKILKKNNFWIYGLDAKAKKNIQDIKNLDEKIALVFGSEEKGIVKLILENCDEVCKINISKQIESLNVSNAVSATLAITSSKI